MNTKWIIIALCIVAIVTAAVVIGVNVQAVASPAADQPGPYKVGFVANTYTDSTRSDNAGGARPIQTYIWYPAAPDNGGNPWSPAVYDIGINGVPPFSSTDFEEYGVDPAYQGAAAAQDGPFPLVVLSPGGKAHPFFYVHIGARLASHGFVVAIPYNYGEGILGEPTTWEIDSPEYGIGTYIDRTRDIQYLMTQLVADSNQPGNLLSRAVRSDQIAVSGHSWGGLAALALAGGDDLACDFPGVDPNQLPPELCVPILPDARIKAIVPLDANNLLTLHYAELARIRIPSLIIGREWDTLKSGGLNEKPLLARPHAAIQGHPNYRVDFANYQHMSFSSACSAMKVLRPLNGDEATDAALKMYCPAEPVPPDETGNLITRYMVAFLKTVLASENGYQEMLTPGYALANEPFVEFFVTEKGRPTSRDEEAYFYYFMHQPGTLQAKALKDPVVP